MKILKLIYSSGALNATVIASKLNMSYGIVFQHLKVLEEEGILLVYQYGRVRLYRFGDSTKAKAIAALFEAWEKQ